MSEEPAEIQLCFQFVTKDGAVIDTGPMPYPTIKAAADDAKRWMELKDQVLVIETYEGLAVSLRSNAIEHVTAMPVKMMADQIAKNKKLAEELYGHAEPS